MNYAHSKKCYLHKKNILLKVKRECNSKRLQVIKISLISIPLIKPKENGSKSTKFDYHISKRKGTLLGLYNLTNIIQLVVYCQNE